ncbi:hypothetical protein DFH27DRAFT_317064 [Peziza echinospora]|nr:hypothetical protein DFH27DRAFT_317064 [Peziza echinospora]
MDGASRTKQRGGRNEDLTGWAKSHEKCKGRGVGTDGDRVYADWRGEGGGSVCAAACELSGLLGLPACLSYFSFFFSFFFLYFFFLFRYLFRRLALDDDLVTGWLGFFHGPRRLFVCGFGGREGGGCMSLGISRAGGGWTSGKQGPSTCGGP